MGPGRRTATAAAVILTLALPAGCGEATGDASSSPTPPASSTPPPDRWRWESYGGVQVAVPGEWGWTNGTQRIGQWCVDGAERDPAPAVGRPGVSTLVLCTGQDGDVPSDMLVRHTGDIVAFEPIVDGTERPTDRGDRLTVTAGAVAVVIQTGDPVLRQRIADTVHEVEVDANGCPVDDAVADDPQRRPPAVGDLADVSGVSSVTACKYAVRRPGDPRDLPPLLASRRFDGAAAAHLVAALVDARAGGGPNAPDQCLAEYSYGDELTVLHVEHASGVQRVLVTYSGCDHNGIDDGTTTRHLTRAAMQPLTSDALAVNGGFSGLTVDYITP